MNLLKTGIIFFLVFIFSIGAVSSQDVNQTDDFCAEEFSDSSSLSSLTGTFIDLNTAISQASKQINVSQEYTFDKEKDKNFSKGIEITNKNITINGNNRIIDANNQSRIFTITSSNVIINNLTFKNSNNYAIFIQNSTLTTNNVIFEDNVGDEKGGAIHALNITYTSVGDKFINNYASKSGSAIYIDTNSTLNIDNSYFESNKSLYYGLIDVTKSKINIANCRFSNITSRYAPAIRAEESTGKIKNCSFSNLTATISAGAVSFKEIEGDIIIDNCTFKNTRSKKNAGAVFIDAAGMDSEHKSSITIINSRFVNCSSEFGGALIQLYGNLTLTNSNFFDNRAVYEGGAIYTSHVNTTVDNVSFKENVAEKSNLSGTMFFDLGTLTLTNSNLTDNAGGLYLFDSNYTISSSYFKGNGNNVYSMFDGKTAVLKANNNFADGNSTLNQIKYKYTYEINSAPLNYNPIIFDSILANASSFDLRKYGLVTSIKAQGWMGSCWSFGSVAALESAILKATNRTLTPDISENNVRNTAVVYSRVGSETTEGGNGDLGGEYFISFGYLSEEEDSYDELGKIALMLDSTNNYYNFEIVTIPHITNLSQGHILKEALVKYGALVVSVLSADSDVKDDFNNTTAAAYSNVSRGSDHAVCLVGWDDNYSASNFKITPPGNGAWIIKNSWGNKWGDDGYYYVSYYEKSIYDVDSYAYIVKPMSYQKIYQYDLSAGPMLTSKTSRQLTAEEISLPTAEIKRIMESIMIPTHFVNIFEADADDLIMAVGTYFKYENDNYTVKISIDGNEVYRQTGNASHVGYQIIKLDKSIPVKKGQKFSIDITSKALVTVSSRNKVPANVTFGENLLEIDSNNTWIDLSLQGQMACIKAYTISIPKSGTIASQNVTRGYNSNFDFKAQLFDAEGKALNETAVNVTVNGNTRQYSTDENGFITVKFTELTVNQKINVVNPVTGEISDNTINVVSRFSGNSNINMYYFDGTSYKFKVHGADGNPVGANQAVAIKINKKTHKVKTNKNGIVTFKIPNTVKPGTYTITATYAGQNVKNTVKIKQVLTATKKTVKKSAKKLVLKATLKNKLKGKTITFKFNGKTYKAKTNKKGIAQVTVKKNVINKLKKGKTYSVKVTYLKNTIKTTVKVK